MEGFELQAISAEIRHAPKSRGLPRHAQSRKTLRIHGFLAGYQVRERVRRKTRPEAVEVTELGTDQHEKEEIAVLAYQFCLERGSPIGSPEEDWFRAKAEVRPR